MLSDAVVISSLMVKSAWQVLFLLKMYFVKEQFISHNRNLIDLGPFV